MHRGKKASISKLLKDLRTHYALHGRAHLPWRGTHDPYKILVSEMMLQQTQVERVVPFYKKFIKHFPTGRSLARAPLKDVLRAWQGLGYNRRAKYLHEAAKVLAHEQATELTAEFLESLPGVGHYTARAIVAFAYNKPEVFVETNIRTVFFYHLNTARKTSDVQLLPLVEQTLAQSRMQPREFYAAMMDYGSYLKRQGVRLNNKSKHYTKQSKFEGSARQLRGAILRELLHKPATAAQLIKNLSRSRGEVERELTRLQAERLLQQARGRFRIRA
jgi:A/G-specific adenine glycosylase